MLRRRRGTRTVRVHLLILTKNYCSVQLQALFYLSNPLRILIRPLHTVSQKRNSVDDYLKPFPSEGSNDY